MAQRFNLTEKEVLDNVAIARAMNTDQQTKLLILAAEMMEKSKYALIIVDSGMAVGSIYITFTIIANREAQTMFSISFAVVSH